MELFMEIATLCVSVSALIVATICLGFTIRQKQLAQKNNDLSGLKVLSEGKDKLEAFLDENIGDIKCFIFDCQSVISNLGSDYDFIREADRKICCGFARIRTIGIASNEQGLIDISCFSVNERSNLTQDMLYARCLCSLTQKYMTASKDKKINKELAKQFLEIFTELYELLYKNIENLIECYENLNNQLYKEVKNINKKMDGIEI